MEADDEGLMAWNCFVAEVGVNTVKDFGGYDDSDDFDGFDGFDDFDDFDGFDGFDGFDDFDEGESSFGRTFACLQDLREEVATFLLSHYWIS